ncbi:unknown [Clostridium sp. CAG:465]|nr:unknown [Clostridium sp. CAG:465]
MDYMSNKALIIAVSLIVTMTVASAVLLIINQVTTIYGQVYETDTSIQNTFDEFDSYDNTEKTLLEFLNTIKKYRNNSNVTIRYNSIDFTTVEEKDKEIDNLKIYLQIEKDNEKISIDTTFSSSMYIANVEKNDNKVIISFKEK